MALNLFYQDSGQGKSVGALRDQALERTRANFEIGPFSFMPESLP